MKTAFLLFFILMLFATQARSQQTFNSLNVKDLSSNKITVTSTTQGSKPCPVMTEAQRDLISALVGQCIYNSDSLQLNVYDGTAWQSAGGGGIDNWETAFDYDIGAVVIESNKIYQANTAHTSTVFATDIANWTQLANNVSDSTGILPLSNGGTSKNITAVNGGVVYTDADSQEVTSAGVSNQVLRSNGSSAPTWSNRSVTAQNQSGTDVTLEEIQAPNLSLTQTGSNIHLLETGNKNILENASFEHSSVLTGWTSGAGSTSRETTIEIDGDASLRVTLSAQALSIRQDSTRYAAQFADGVDGLVGAWVKTSLSNIYVCTRAAGVSLVSATFSNCVAVASNNKWAFYQIPTILGATSNGVEVASYNSSGVSVAVTGDVYIDDAFVGAINTRGTTTIDTAWSSCGHTTADFTGFGTVTNIETQCKRDGSDLLMRGKFTSGVPTGVEARLNLKLAGLALTSASTSSIPSLQFAGGHIGNGTIFRTNFPLVEPSVGYITFGYQEEPTGVGQNTLTKANGNALTSNGFVLGITARVPIAGWSSNSDYYSASCGANCVDTFSAEVSGTGVVTSESVNFINGNCSVSDTSLYTCTWNTGIFTTGPNCVANTTSTNNGLKTDKESIPTLTQGVFRGSNSTSGAKTATPFTLICQKQGADFTASRTIVGSFKEVVTTPGVSRPRVKTAVLNCDASSSIISQKGTTWISSIGNIDGNGNCTTTLVSGTFIDIPDCSLTRHTTSGFSVGVDVGGAATSSTVVLSDGEDDNGATATSYDFTLICHGSAP